MQRIVPIAVVVVSLLFPVSPTQAFSVEDGAHVRVPLPWTDETDEEARKRVDALTVRVAREQQAWDIPLPGGRMEERDYVQFGSWQLPLNAGQSVRRFAMVRRREAIFPTAPIEASLKEKVLPSVSKPRQDVTIRPAEGGRVAFEGTGSAGARLDMQEMLRSIYAAVEQGVPAIEAPVVPDPPHVRKEGLADLQVQELIGTGVSDFSGSPKNRIINIQVGLARFDGIVIRKGETFSFNHQLGPVDGKHGFEPELVIVGPRTQKEFGGGLCQVSSTMFRAALYAGLPITARRNHSYAVDYYKWPEGWGFDATIYPGVQDMKFINDTPGDIAVQATIEGSRVYYRFYGINDGRQVEVGAPSTYNHRAAPPTQTVHVSGMAPGRSRVREKPHAGFTASFARTVVMPTGEKRSQTFTSVYQARPQVIETGSAAGPSPTPEIFYTGDIS